MPMPRGQRGKRPLPRALEEALRAEACLQLLERQPERAETAWLHRVDVELEDPALGVDRHAALDDDLHPVRRPEDEQLRGRAEHHRVELAAVVLQREVDVARCLRAEVRDLARHPERAEALPDGLVDGPDEFGDGVDVRRGCRPEHHPAPRAVIPRASRRTS
jgi:hypothetical protein